MPTERPQRFVKQLVTHLGRHRTAELLTPDEGRIQWPDGACGLSCESGVLVLVVTADDADALARVQDTVARHLERFGAREDLRVRWSPAG